MLILDAILAMMNPVAAKQLFLNFMGERRNDMSTFKLAMEYPLEPLAEPIKEKIIETVAYIRGIDRDKLEARLIKEDKTVTPYKVFACKKQPKKEAKTAEPSSKIDYRYNGCSNTTYYPSHHCCYPITSYSNDSFPMEDQSGNTPEEAIEKFFTEAVKSIGKQQKIKEKEFGKLEKELASMNYIIKRISSYANKEEIAKELVDKKEESIPPIQTQEEKSENKPTDKKEEITQDLTKEIAEIRKTLPQSSSLQDIEDNKKRKEEENKHTFLRQKYGLKAPHVTLSADTILRHKTDLDLPCPTNNNGKIVAV